MSADRIRVLLVEDSETDALLICATLGDASAAEFDVTEATRLEEAQALIERDSYDLVLLDLGLPDSSGIDTFTSLRDRVGGIPVLVLTSLSDEAVGTEAVRCGAEDYLIKGEMQGPLLGRVLRYAVERHRLQASLDRERGAQERDREIREVAQISGKPSAPMADRSRPIGPLSESAPDVFRELTERYSKSLGHSLEQRAFKVEYSASEELEALSGQLAAHRAGPRDVIEIHTSALRESIETAPHQKAQALMEEGRLMVLELMGHLAAFYRRGFNENRPTSSL